MASKRNARTGTNKPSRHPDQAAWAFLRNGRADSDFDLLVVLPDNLPEVAYGHKAVAAHLVETAPGHWTNPDSSRSLIVPCPNQGAQMSPGD